MRKKTRTNFDKFKDDLYKYYFDRYLGFLLEFGCPARSLSFREFLVEICELPYARRDR